MGQGGGKIDGMGMITNFLGSMGYGPGAGGTPTPTPTPAAPPPVVPPMKQMPGYAGRPMPQFGNMNPADLERYSAEKGIPVPGKPNAKFPLPR